MRRYWPTWLGLVTGIAVVFAALVAGSDAMEQWQLAARWTARASFPFFIVTFVASALVRLYPSTWTKALLRDRRWWGLGFAAAFVTHLVALSIFQAMRGNIPATGHTDPNLYLNLILLGMILTSTDSARQALGRAWRIFHAIGMWGFWLVFAVTPYLGAIIALEMPTENPLLDPYTLTCVAGALLKLAAWRKSRAKRTERMAT